MIGHPFELFEDYRYAESQYSKKTCVRNIIMNVKFLVHKTFLVHFPLNFHDSLVKILVRIIHPNYVFSRIFRPKEVVLVLHNCVLYLAKYGNVHLNSNFNKLASMCFKQLTKIFQKAELLDFIRAIYSI